MVIVSCVPRTLAPLGLNVRDELSGGDRAAWEHQTAVLEQPKIMSKLFPNSLRTWGSFSDQLQSRTASTSSSFVPERPKSVRQLGPWSAVCPEQLENVENCIYQQTAVIQHCWPNKCQWKSQDNYCYVLKRVPYCREKKWWDRNKPSIYTEVGQTVTAMITFDEYHRRGSRGLRVASGYLAAQKTTLLVPKETGSRDVFVFWWHA
jgi:hypothetical protein